MSAHLNKPVIHAGDILQALKNAVRECVENLSSAHGRDLPCEFPDRFFLRVSDRIVWGRLFQTTLRDADIELLSREHHRWTAVFQWPVQVIVFFPSWEISQQERLNTLPGMPRFFEYYLRRTPQGQSIGLIEKRVLDSEQGKARPFPLSRQVSSQTSLQPENSSFPSLLTRDEIAELVKIRCEMINGPLTSDESFAIA